MTIFRAFVSGNLGLFGKHYCDAAFLGAGINNSSSHAHEKPCSLLDAATIVTADSAKQISKTKQRAEHQSFCPFRSIYLPGDHQAHA